MSQLLGVEYHVIPFGSWSFEYVSFEKHVIFQCINKEINCKSEYLVFPSIEPCVEVLLCSFEF
jgi:hypothetical protein